MDASKDLQQHDRGNTRAQQQDTPAKADHAPRQPNERDESADSQSSQAAGNRAVGKLAHDDVTSGRQDTDRGPVVDQVYNQGVRNGAPKAPPQR
jgi:hypothetical protein